MSPAAQRPGSERNAARARRKRSIAAKREERISFENVQRARLLAAMVRVAAERGAARTNVSDVVAVAGVSRRTFYEMFENVAECFDDAAHLAYEQARAIAIEAWRDAGAGWPEGVRAALAALLRHFDEHPDVARVLLIEWQVGGERAQRERAAAIGLLARALDGARRTGAAGASEPPSPITAEAAVGAACSVLSERLRQQRTSAAKGEPLSALLKPLMSFLVLPYLGRAAAQSELRQRSPQPARRGPVVEQSARPRAGRPANIRLTFRTLKVLAVIAERQDVSNRQIADAAGITDQGQASKLLARLKRSGLIENANGHAAFRGQPNRWRLTAEGHRVLRGLPLA